MENPQTWGVAERVVAQALADAQKAREEGVVGLSVVRRVTDALRESGLLLDPQEPSIGPVAQPH